MDRSLRKLMKVMPPLKGQRHTKVNWKRLEEGVGLTYPQSFKDFVSVYGSSHWFDKFSRSPTLGGKVVSWRAGARLFREMWPLIQAHVPEDNFRAEFVRDLLRLFMDWDMDGTDLRRVHPEIDKALDDLGAGEG